MRSTLFTAIFISGLAIFNVVAGKKGGGGTTYPDCGAPFCGRKRANQLLVEKVKVFEGVKRDAVDIESKEGGSA
ncbi:hypothetical protein NX059_003054 [Plenodomus lindquistii]|nr:hypothetical protein NX059_003054 [Plenodomus lindquistii]